MQRSPSAAATPPPCPPAEASSSIAAVIDVGTNSTKLLVARIDPHSIDPLFEGGTQTRLGRGFYADHVLQPGPIQETAECVARYAAQARSLGATRLQVIATSAARDARNAADLLQAIRKSSQLETQIITGDQEAQWAFQGVCSHPHFQHHTLVVLDVGGGSTEVIVGQNSNISFHKSFPLGSVRLLERFGSSDSTLEPSVRSYLRDFLDQQIAPEVEPALRPLPAPAIGVGVGGATALLALIHHRSPHFDRVLVESTEFSPAVLKNLSHQLWALSLEARRELPGLPPERADVMPFGAALYEAFVDRFQLAALRPSTRGIRYAALLHAASHPG